MLLPVFRGRIVADIVQLNQLRLRGTLVLLQSQQMVLTEVLSGLEHDGPKHL